MDNEDKAATQKTTDSEDTPNQHASHSHRRVPSGSSILSRFPFIRSSSDNDRPRTRLDLEDEADSRFSPRASLSILQQQKTRRRRGSLRKVALLGKGAQRERRDGKPLTIDTSHPAEFGLDPTASKSIAVAGAASRVTGEFTTYASPTHTTIAPGFGDENRPLSHAHPTSNPQPSSHRMTGQSIATTSTVSSISANSYSDRDGPPTYTSTDEDDVLVLPRSANTLRQGLGISPGPDSYFTGLGSISQRRRTIQQAKSPLSYPSVLPPHDEWDYSDTEWWGWVVLGATWLVFVVGMGSCLDVWSWAWDVGTTPYAPPELEDDPTLPIVGYYPTLIILTGVMAWVWVVVAWVGMKYFRHAKMSGD